MDGEESVYTGANDASVWEQNFLTFLDFDFGFGREKVKNGMLANCQQDRRRRRLTPKPEQWTCVVIHVDTMQAKKI